MEITHVLRRSLVKLDKMCGSTLVRIFLFIILITASYPFTSLCAEQPERIWIPASRLAWTGKVSDPEEIEIVVNSEILSHDSISANVHDGILHIIIPLEYGKKNHVRIAQHNKDLFSADVICMATVDSDFIPEGYIFSPFHTAENEKTCMKCHRLDLDEKAISPTQSVKDVCSPCHKNDISNKAFEHAAYINGLCILCHQPQPMENEFTNGTPARFLVEDAIAVAPVCYKCHVEAQAKYSSFEYIHAPVSMNVCDTCHDPHGGDDKYFFKKDISTLCVTCHGLEEMLEQPVIHKPITERGCPACHNGHGSNYPYFLANKNNGLCLNCHDNIEENNHPVNGHPTDYTDDSGKHITCLSCHDPHSSEFKYLLPAEETMGVCIRCHQAGK